MKLSFPHIGNAYIPVKGLLDDLQVNYIIPPFNNKKSLELGTKYSPEMACLQRSKIREKKTYRRR